MEKPGILVLSPFFRPNIGGVETYLNDLCEYLIKQNYKVFVVTYQPLTTKAKGLKYEKKDGLEISRISWFGHNWFHKLEPYPLLEFLYLTPCLFIFSFFFILRNSRKISVIHANGLNAAFITKFLAWFFKKRAIISICAVYNFQKKSIFSSIVRWTLAKFDKILALTNFSKRELVHIGLPKGKIDTYYLWIDKEIYKPENKEMSKEKINMENKFTVLFVGRLIKKKGIGVLLEVAKKVDKKIHFVFIGDDGWMLETVERASKQTENIILVKGICGNQLVPYYQGADILIIPSQYNEAFGKVIIEALSCGTPVIGANRGAIPDVLDTSIGRVVDPTVENIKREIEYFYSNPEELHNITSGCRDYALKYFSEKNAEVIEKSYS